MKVSIFAAVGILCVLSAIGVSAQEVEKKRIINGGTLNGKAKSLPKPDYPSHLRDQGIGGTVSVDVEIDESGLVISAKAKSSTAQMQASDEGMSAEKRRVHLELVEAAEAAAREAQFSPTFLSGEPVRIKGTIFYNFVPKDGENVEKAAVGDVLNGKAIELPPPAYPPAAKAVRASGTVSVAVVIDESGNVISSEAVSGHPLLRSAAVNASKEAKFAPTVVDGQAVRVKGVVVYNFVP